MDIAKIKQLVKQNGDKFVFIENGEPEFVMMSFQEYEKFFRSYAGGVPETKNIHKRFEQRPEIKSESVFTETEFMPPNAVAKKASTMPIRPEDIRLEDLPLC